MIVFAILLSVFLGFSAALMVVGFWVSKSNDRGNSKGSFRDFSQGVPVHILESRDRIKY